MPSLPIDELASQFRQQLRTHDLVVTAETGSGKSTRLPLWASEQGKVLVVEPRRIACVALARYLARQRDEQPGESVGYAIRFESRVSKASQVVFVTPGVALRWLSEDGLAGYAVVMLDEFHERRWDTDLLLALLKKRQQHRLLLTSATIESEKIARFVGGQTLHAEGRTYPVTIRHQSGDLRQMPTTRQLSQRVKGVIEQALNESDKDILVFLPGKKEIREAMEACQTLPVLCLGLHAGSDEQTQSQALNKQPRQRVIFTTNVAETSLTIPNVGVVIDSGLERRTHLRGGRMVLGLDPIAMDAAAQRAGRAGRTSAGLCIRLYGQHAPLNATTPVQLQRESLEDFVLSAACCGEDVTVLPLLSPPDEKALQRALTLLQELDAIDQQRVVTAHGRALHPLPVAMTLSHLLVRMPTSALKQAMADIAAVIAAGGKTYSVPMGADWEKLTEQVNPLCDASLLVRWLREPQSLPLTYDQAQWREARRYSQALRSIFGLPSLEESETFDRSELVATTLKASPTSGFVKRRNRRGAFGNGDIEVVLGDASIVDEQSEAIVVLDSFSLAGRAVKDSKTFATVAMPVGHQELARVGLGEREYREPRIQGQKIVQLEVQNYAGVEIMRREVTASGKTLLAALTELIGRQALFAGVYPQLDEHINAYGLYCQLKGEKAVIPTPSEHIHKRLVTLGVESLDDLALIEAHDLAFDGIPEWELADFLDTYPQQVTLPSLLMTVDYQPGAKRLTLHYHSGQRKDPPKRWELPAWSGWRIRYQKASKVVDIK
ncbi:RNA helicase [Saliniradius amylolyticus]|uniref:RNA helicase n=1 Tax=Saliniradius amylolyticus TaxID=2183582 RepID=A0A2S2E650_9ALTE|nr:helicase-related protein [Saliniradius amylolyticus]AWL13136.1 RNA helicase [Saliniradius amylolyticus]